MRLTPDTPVSVDDAARLFAPLTEFAVGRPVTLAVSGGPDSTALMGLYAEVAAKTPLPPASVVTIDHGLRHNSAQDTDHVMAMARDHGFKAHVLKWTGDKPSSGVQEAARTARYRLLGEHMKRAGSLSVLVAHTLDDQAETVLMRLSGGSGLRGLGAMDSFGLVHGALVHRPFLAISKRRLTVTCDARGWRYLHDPSNTNPSFLRVRLRQLMPVLAREGLTSERLARLAMRLRRADEALDMQTLQVIEACRVWKRGIAQYDAAQLAREPEEIVIRFFVHVISLNQGAASHADNVRLERIETLAAEFVTAVRNNAGFRRNLGRVLFTVRNGMLSLRPEPERRHKT